MHHRSLCDRPRRTVTALAWLVLGACLYSRTAYAGDGVYDRMNGDLVVSAGLGGGVTTQDRTRGVGIAEVEALYLDSAGSVLILEHLGGPLAMAWGIKLRPLFLARFFMGSWTGRSAIDLFVDSLALETGAWLGPWERAGQGGGVSWWLGSSFDVPLGGERSGLHVRLAARYVHHDPHALLAPGQTTRGWRLVGALVYAGVLDMGIAAPRPDPP